VTILAWLDTSGSGTTTFAPFHEAQLDVFRAANPMVTVTVEPIGDANKLQANVVAGTPPDIFRTSYPTMYQYQKQGVLEPIDAYLDKRGKTDFYDWARDISTIGGTMYEWPWLLNPVGPVVTRSVFKEKRADALLPPPGPKADWTFDQWKAAMKAVTSVTGDSDRDTYGTAFAALDNGRDEGRLPEVADIRTQFNAMVKDVFQGNKTPKDGLDEMVRLSLPIMARSTVG